MAWADTDKTNLSTYFKSPHETIATRGMEKGIILKFKNFYLKIYDADGNSSYNVKGYRYNEQEPIFEDVVKSTNMKTYAAEIESMYGLN